jgi:hypothetical protein
MGLPSVARLQREEVSRAKKEARGTGTFPTGIYGGLHPLLNFANVFDLANHTANAHNLLETLHLLELRANAIHI